MSAEDTQCDNCHFWSPIPDAPPTGYCHRHAPTPASKPTTVDDPGAQAPIPTAWPATQDTDWCGEFTPMSPEEARTR